MAGASRAIASAMQILMEQYAGLHMYFVPAWVPTRSNVCALTNVRKINRVIAEVIRVREASADSRIDLLSILLSAKDVNGHGMTSRQLRDEVVTMFLAGHETTANALSWTWYLLARHPQVETRMISELRDVLGDRTPAVSDIARLQYTSLVIKESMRLYPPVGGIGRETRTKLQIGPYIVPAGTNIFMSQWLMHRNPRYFDEPDAFIPERWTADFERQLPAFAYFPFGGGPRLCIGTSFAMTEMIVLLALIARKFRLRLVSQEQIKPVFSISLRPSGGVRMLVEKR
jgi:cytochrome P450